MEQHLVKAIKGSLARKLGLSFINFVKPGKAGTTHQKQGEILSTSEDWNLKVDLQQPLSFPPEIVATTLLWYMKTRTVRLL